MIVNCNELITLDTEIRKLKPAQIYKLSTLLNISDSWKKLMAIVPKENSEGLKFNFEHFCLIEEASRQQKRSCGEIFLDEWSTMGRKKPTVKILLDLLTRANLYRAADFIAINVLNWKEGPRRPNLGPAAQIDMSGLILESSDGVESSSSISGEVNIDHSHLNNVENPVECILQKNISEEKQLAYPIPAFLNDVTFSSESAPSIRDKSAEEINSTSSSQSDDSESIAQESSENSEINFVNSAANLPLCLREMDFSSESGVSSKVLIPRLVEESTSSA